MNSRGSIKSIWLTLILVITGLSLFASPAYGTVDPLTEEDHLFDMSIEELMNVEVTTVSKKEDTLHKTPAAITVLTAEDIRRSGHQSIPEVLRSVPGIHVAKIDSNRWAITSRGFNSLYSAKLLVLIDGRSVYTPLFSGVYWDFQDLILEDVERIEVVKGPGGTLWGANAVNGVINIITKQAADTQGTLVTVGTGTEEKGFSSLRHGGKLGDNAYYRVYAKYLNRDEAVYANGDHANDRFDALREGFRIDWNISEQDNITLQGDVYDGHSAKRVRLTSPGVNFQMNDNVDGRGLNVLTRWTRTYSDSSDMSLQFYYDRTERHAVSLDESRDTFDIDFHHRFQLVDGHNLIWGLGYRHSGDNIDNTYTLTFNPSSFNEELFTGFIQDEIVVVGDLLKFIVGTKIVKNDYTGYEFQPSARLLWTPNKKNTAWASFTRAVSTPSRSFVHMTNRFNAVPPMQFSGSNHLKSQEVKAYELGYRLKPKENLFFDFSFFYNEYDHLYATENNPTVFSRIHDNKMYGETYGTEITSHWYVNENWRLTGGYSFIKMQMRTQNSSTNTARASRKEKETPQNKFQVTSQLNLQENLELNTMLYYCDSVPYYDVPSYIRFDMGLTWHISRNMTFSLIGQNLLDRAHPEFGDGGIIATEVQRAILGKFVYNF